jgi:hypothetical protein
MSFDIPILLLVFNRPETTAQVFQRIKEIQPVKLFIAADGPRAGKEGEKEKCEAVRKLILDGINWDCDVKTLFRDSNLGCGKAVSGAITWFFENVEEGIILEDDTLPDLSFFTFCKTLLEKYRNDEKVKIISGNNFQNGRWRGDGSYYFSAYSHIWGWASWRRAWKEYDFNLSDISDFSFEELLNERFSNVKEKKHWRSIYQNFRSGHYDTWDFQFLFKMWEKKGKCIIPNKNLVSNIGFGNNATHTVSADDPIAGLPLGNLSSVSHPAGTMISKDADLYLFKNYLAQNKKWINKLKNFIKIMR